jgi:hypothetical protein
VQVASSDGASDLVNATVGISAFIEKPKPEDTQKTPEKPKIEPTGAEKETKNAQN